MTDEHWHDWLHHNTDSDDSSSAPSPKDKAEAMSRNTEDSFRESRSRRRHVVDRTHVAYINPRYLWRKDSSAADGEKNHRQRSPTHSTRQESDNLTNETRHVRYHGPRRHPWNYGTEFDPYRLDRRQEREKRSAENEGWWREKSNSHPTFGETTWRSVRVSPAVSGSDLASLDPSRWRRIQDFQRPENAVGPDTNERPKTEEYALKSSQHGDSQKYTADGTGSRDPERRQFIWESENYIQSHLFDRPCSEDYKIGDVYPAASAIDSIEDGELREDELTQAIEMNTKLIGVVEPILKEPKEVPPARYADTQPSQSDPQSTNKIQFSDSQEMSTTSGNTQTCLSHGDMLKDRHGTRMQGFLDSPSASFTSLWSEESHSGTEMRHRGTDLVWKRRQYMYLPVDVYARQDSRWPSSYPDGLLDIKFPWAGPDVIGLAFVPPREPWTRQVPVLEYDVPDDLERELFATVDKFRCGHTVTPHRRESTERVFKKPRIDRSYGKRPNYD